METVLFDKSADIGYQWLRNRDQGIAPTEHSAPCGSDAFVVPHLTLGEGKSGTLGDKKWYRSLIS
jgi:hypothetical protein